MVAEANVGLSRQVVALVLVSELAGSIPVGHPTACLPQVRMRVAQGIEQLSPEEPMGVRVLPRMLSFPGGVNWQHAGFWPQPVGVRILAREPSLFSSQLVPGWCNWQHAGFWSQKSGFESLPGSWGYVSVVCG